MAQLITKPEVIAFLNMLTSVTSEHLKLEDITYDELREEYRNKSIKELDVRWLTRAMVIGFKSKTSSFTFNPPGELHVGQGDTTIIIGTSQNISSFKDTYS